MPRYAAFLRAINVGGHVVKMSDLKRVFEALGFAKVETFIASGNVLFETRATNAVALESRIEAALKRALGYEVATFLRTEAELSRIAQHEAFKAADLATAVAHCVVLLRAAPSGDTAERIRALASEADVFHVHERELYWLSRLKQ